ncbi:MAG: heat-inducible transcription repressor HrcA [Deltaproteobacteria bacterium]|jgi:heat-inducible transcriptional repressor|nr:heat-inducible transcription repressor HrcA [Deltaproteobacteria bacterium]
MSGTELTERQKLILGLVVQEFVDSATPVGSKVLVSKYKLEISSATVRNEMAELADRGYLRQPHTSAGRVPTEDAYRFFVRELMQHPELPVSLRHTIQHQFYQARHDSSEWMPLAASVLATHANAASIVTAPQSERPRYKHLQLISTAGRQVLMVLVMMGGRVSQQMLVLSEPVSQEKLSAAAEKLNNLIYGQGLEDISSTPPPDLDTLTEDMYKLALDELKRADSTVTGEVYHDGWTNVLAEPEFAESENARRALRLLEERPRLENLLSQTVMNSEIGGVQVLIGGEDNWEELSDCSLVLARYGVPDLASGILGVLGPIRMPYGHTISTVNFMANLLSNMVGETMSNDPFSKTKDE